jgi:alpha-L-fucosidase 2
MTALRHITAATTLSESFVFNCIRNCHKVSGRNLVTLILLVQIAAIQLFGTPQLWGRDLFPIDRKGVVERSDIILARPALLPIEAMPLGNGRLGVAVWSQDGFTAQLNRGDTFPKRLSPGQIIIPTLDKLAKARDYRGRLNLYAGEFEQSGGGLTAVMYVDEALDVLVIDVKGADPQEKQTAVLRLWSPRKPQVISRGTIGALAETWLDDHEAGASNERFGSLAAITADARNVHATSSDSLSVTLTFMPRSDGSFRILVGAPSWRGGDADAASSKLMARAQSIRIDQHRAWWSTFWEHAGLIKLSSPDHRAEYFENLRTIYLFTAAAESRDRFPGSQAGIGDLFSSARDQHRWGPSAFWQWNLRMQVSANLGAGASDLNASYFRLYQENLDNILNWTRQHMGGRQGACVPETMRFNGRGYENEEWIPNAPINCGEDSPPYYNARTISTGAEVSVWVWAQYEYTDDLAFLKRNYPLMREAARFLLAYATTGPDGKLHTFPSNAHEMQWDVHDPTTDISAMRALFPRVILAATLLKTDSELVTELRAALTKLMPLPFATVSSPTVLSKDGADAAEAIIAASYNPDAKIHNVENIGLEPVWPYTIIGDDEALHKVAVRTFLNRPYKNEEDWSYDPVQAARLGLSNELSAGLFAITDHYQVYPSGLSAFSPSEPGGSAGAEPYVEQVGVLADALQIALADDYDNLIRIAPAWPQDWDADGTVYLPHGNKADVRLRHGELVCVGVEIASSGPVRVRNPWPGQQVAIIDVDNSSTVSAARSDGVLTFSGHPGTNYLLERVAHKSLLLETVSGTPATAPKSLGSRTIGLAK